MNRVARFEIVVLDIERAKDFYTKVFNWTFEKWPHAEMEYWLINTVPEGTPGAINGGMRKEMGTDIKTPTVSVNAFIATIQVENIDDILAKVSAFGGKVLVPKVATPGLGFFASCYDTEGNVFSLMQAE